MTRSIAIPLPSQTHSLHNVVVVVAKDWFLKSFEGLRLEAEELLSG